MGNTAKKAEELPELDAGIVKAIDGALASKEVDASGLYTMAYRRQIVLLMRDHRISANLMHKYVKEPSQPTLSRWWRQYEDDPTSIGEPAAEPKKKAKPQKTAEPKSVPAKPAAPKPAKNGKPKATAKPAVAKPAPAPSGGSVLVHESDTNIIVFSIPRTMLASGEIKLADLRKLAAKVT